MPISFFFLEARLKCSCGFQQLVCFSFQALHCFLNEYFYNFGPPASWETLTALHRNRGSLQRQHLPVGLRDVNSEHHSDPRVLPSNVSFPLAQLDV